jgi:hypothetical protein
MACLAADLIDAICWLRARLIDRFSPGQFAEWHRLVPTPSTSSKQRPALRQPDIGPRSVEILRLTRRITTKCCPHPTPNIN